MEKSNIETKIFIQDFIKKLDPEFSGEENRPCISHEDYSKIRNNYLNYTGELRKKLENRLKEVFAKSRDLSANYIEGLFNSISSKDRREARAKRDMELALLENHPSIKKYFEISVEAIMEFIMLYYYEENNIPFDFSLYQGRPSLKLQYDQHYCTPETTLRRIKLILRDFSSPETKVLFLGDDDLASITLRSLSSFETHAIDIDEQLLSFIEGKKLDVKIHRVDLTKDVPDYMVDYFDVVMFDPYWDMDGALMFLKSAVKCLKKSKTSRIYLSISPLFFPENYIEFQRKILDLNLFFVEILRYFNWYELRLVEQKVFFDVLHKINRESINDELFDLLFKIPYGTSHMHVLSLKG